MKIEIEERPSGSPFVERIWRSYSDEINKFTSIVANPLDLVVWKYQGKTNLTLRGQETKATTAPVPEYGVFSVSSLKWEPSCRICLTRRASPSG